MKRLLTPGKLALAGLVLLAAVLLLLWLGPSGDYILLPDKARPVAPLVTVVDGQHPPARKGGQIYFLDVLVRKATLGEYLFPWLHGDATLVPASELRAPGVSEQQQHRIDVHEMSQSQNVAAIVALRALGYKVSLGRTGPRILKVIRGTPAAGKLHAADVIAAVNGKLVQSECTLRRLLGARRPGDVVRLTVRHAGGTRTVRLRLAAEGGRPVIGVIVSDQTSHIRLPFPVKINAGSVVGPSAGLAFALEIAKKLGRNVDRGYKVAATGELEPDGCVLPIGGVKQKTIEANRSHVDILLVPVGDNANEARRYAGRVRVIAVNSFQQALHELATVPPKT